MHKLISCCQAVIIISISLCLSVVCLQSSLSRRIAIPGLCFAQLLPFPLSPPLHLFLCFSI